MRGVLAALCLLAFTLFPASMSAAHSQLMESLPADDSVVDEPPSSVTFVFNENLIEANNTIAIVDATGNVVHTERVSPDDNEVSIAWPDSLSEGVWQVSYRVVSADGHPVQGAIVFTVNSDQFATEPQSSTRPATPDDANASATSVVSQTEEMESTQVFPLVLGGAFVVLLVFITGIALAKKRQQR